MRSKWFSEKTKLEELILNKNLSYEEIGKLYNCTGANIKKVAKRIGIAIPERRQINEKETFDREERSKKRFCLNCGKLLYQDDGKNYRHKFCSNLCQREYYHKIKYQKLIDGDISLMRANYNPYIFKEDILKEQNGMCAICGIGTKWNNKPLVFILDHIDGRASNNKRDNLRCICPNCDSQLETYKSKNKNSDRNYYRHYK